MCIAIYSLHQDSAIELSFVLERIYQQRDGGARIDMDVPVKNTGNIPVNHLRVLVPFSMVEIGRLEKLRAEKKIEKRIVKLQQRQLENVELRTDELAIDSPRSKWIYKVLIHVSIERSEMESGVFVVKRNFHGNSHGDTLQGFLKQGWKIKHPDESGFPKRTWLLYAIISTALFDIVQDGNNKECIQPGERMWVRLSIHVLRDVHNTKSWLEKVFARSLEYRQVFMSPTAVLRFQAGREVSAE